MSPESPYGEADVTINLKQSLTSKTVAKAMVSSWCASGLTYTTSLDRASAPHTSSGFSIQPQQNPEEGTRGGP